MGKMKWLRKTFGIRSIQTTITVAFSVVTVLGMAFLGVTLYDMFAARSAESKEESTEQLLSQTSINLENYLRSMRLISDSMYYSGIKESDLSVDTLDTQMNLLYEANKDNLISISCYTKEGERVASVPFVTVKDSDVITSQDWFAEALAEPENFHFSTPHVQNQFDSSTYRYYWVVSLSRAVELTMNGHTTQGVLVIDMNYSSIEHLFEKLNKEMKSEYVYLCNSNGEIIYHPKQNLLYAGLAEENNSEAANYSDGASKERFQGEDRRVNVKTVGYTGWKIVAVRPDSEIGVGFSETKYFVIIIVCIVVLAMIIVNNLISLNVTRPLERLTKSVKVRDNGLLDENIYVGGSNEVRYLGKTLKDAADKMRALLDDFMEEEKAKRRTELDALQSQINPHFLYNTLDSIVWMIEADNNKDAVFMIKELASLFRISLSRGKTIIRVEDEFRHAQNYMNIQRVRYKNKFKVTFDMDEDIANACIVKLVIQPILENAIEYGVSSMDDEGEILVHGYRQGDEVFIEVKDNGIGMPEEVSKRLLIEENRVQTKGSGVGLINVHKRIQLRFGEEYGLRIKSEPDQGTAVVIHLPYREMGGEPSGK